MPQQSGTSGPTTTVPVQIGQAPAAGHAAAPTVETPENLKKLPKMMEDSKGQIDALFMGEESNFRWPLLALIKRDPNKVKYSGIDFKMKYMSNEFNQHNDSEQSKLNNKLHEVLTSGYNDFKESFKFGFTDAHGEDERLSFAMSKAIVELQSDRVSQIDNLIKRLPASLREYVDLFLVLKNNIKGIMSSNTLELGVNQETLFDLIARYDNFERTRFMHLSDPSWTDVGKFIVDPTAPTADVRTNEVAKHLLNHMHSVLKEQLDDIPDTINKFNEVADLLHPIIKEIGKFKVGAKINAGKIDEVKQKGAELKIKLTQSLDLNGRNNKVHEVMSEVGELYSRYLTALKEQKIKDYFSKRAEKPEDTDYKKMEVFYHLVIVPWICLVARYKIYVAILDRYLTYLSNIDEILNKKYQI